MALFSQRAGLRPITKLVQKESIDEDLRNALWSSFHDTFVKAYHYNEGSGGGSPFYPHQQELDRWGYLLWTQFYKLPSDTRPKFSAAIQQIRQDFFGGQWHWVLDFLE